MVGSFSLPRQRADKRLEVMQRSSKQYEGMPMFGPVLTQWLILEVSAVASSGYNQ